MNEKILEFVNEVPLIKPYNTIKLSNPSKLDYRLRTTRLIQLTPISQKLELKPKILAL
ncbi:MAG: hypothetical protein ACFFDN_44205 [Candidatus Hodarchaeota archaeon]